MKKLFTLLIVIEFTFSTSAQPPDKLSYQAVIRTTNGSLITNQNVGIRISILHGSPTGTPHYVETHRTITNANGLATIEIGGGTVVSGTFSDIDWSNGTYFIKNETDPSGGTNYTISGTSQILSVPYALYAKKAGNGSLWSQNASNIYFDNGKVGIGTNNPMAPVHANGEPVANRGQLSLSAPAGKDIFLSFYEDDIYKSYLSYDASDGDIRFQNYTTGDLNLNPYGGKVGIGTNTPSQTLDVSGNINLTGILYQNGSPFTVSWANIGNKPTTISGYGIADAVTTSGDQTITGVKTFIGTINVGNKTITNIANPVNNSDAANKAYVDALKKQIKVLEDNLISAGTYKLIDVEGNEYDVVKIRNQVWMAENLKTTHFNNGDTIPTISFELPAYCYYDNSISNATLYGNLYNWHAVRTDRLCPVGWHVPTDSDWDELITYLGGNDVAGGKMKASGTLEEGNGLWKSPNTGATNESGFASLPGGYGKGDFKGIGTNAYYWSYTNYQGVSPAGDYVASMLQLNFDNISISRDLWYNWEGLSVRCVKNPPLPSAIVNGFTINDLRTIATIQYSIKDDIGYPVIERGICYNTSRYNICQYKTSDGTGIGSFTATVAGIELFMGLWIRAYATTIKGTAYSEPVFMRINY